MGEGMQAVRLELGLGLRLGGKGGQSGGGGQGGQDGQGGKGGQGGRGGQGGGGGEGGQSGKGGQGGEGGQGAQGGGGSEGSQSGEGGQGVYCLLASNGQCGSVTRHFVPLRATFRAPARIWLAVIDFQNGKQQSRSGSDKKRRNRLQ